MKSCIDIPRGWQRVIKSQIVLYIAPSSEELKSKDDILKYLTSPGTCKCGLKCPLHLDSVFSFDAAIKSKEHRDSKQKPLTDKINRPPKDAVKGLPAEHSCGLKTAPQIIAPQQSVAPGNGTTDQPERNENEARYRPPPPALPPISVFCQDNQYTHTQILQFLYTNLEMSLRSVSMHPEYQRQYRLQMMNHPGIRAQLMARQQMMVQQYRHLSPQQMQQLQAQQIQMHHQMQQQQSGVSPQKYGPPPRPQLVPSPQLAGQRPMAPPPYSRLPKPNDKRSSKAPKKPSGMLQLVQSGPRNITPRPEKTKKPPPQVPAPTPPAAVPSQMVVQQQMADKSGDCAGKPTLFVSLQPDKKQKRSPGMGDGPLPSVDSLLKTCSTLNTLPDIDRGLSAAAAGRVDGAPPIHQKPPSPHHPSPPRHPGPSPPRHRQQTSPGPHGHPQYYPQHPSYRQQNYHRLTLRPSPSPPPSGSNNSRAVRHPNISIAHSTLPPNTTPNVQIAPNMVAAVSYPGQQFFRHPGTPGYPHLLGVPLNPPPKPASAKHSDKWEGVLSPSEVDAKVQEILSSPQKSDQSSAPATPTPATTAASISDKKRKRQQSAPQMFDRYPGNPFLRVGGNAQPKAAKLSRVEPTTQPQPVPPPAIAPAPPPAIAPAPPPASPSLAAPRAPPPAAPRAAQRSGPTSIIIGSSGALLTPPPGILSMVKYTPPPSTEVTTKQHSSNVPPDRSSPKTTSPVIEPVSTVSSVARTTVAAPHPAPLSVFSPISTVPKSVPKSPSGTVAAKTTNVPDEQIVANSHRSTNSPLSSSDTKGANVFPPSGSSPGSIISAACAPKNE